MSNSPTVPAPPPDLFYHYILPHSGRPAVLLERDPDGWRLPLFRPQTRFLGRVGQVTAAARRQLGVEAVTLLCVDLMDHRPALHQVDATYSMEIRDPAWQPGPSHAWFGRAELAEVGLAVAGEQRIVSSYLRELESGLTPPLRKPWATRGWYSRASAWIDEECARLGRERTGPVEQVKQLAFTAVLKAPTRAGDLYFKAVPPIFGAEPSVTAALARLFPGVVPSPLATMRGTDESWMLTEDFGGEVLFSITEEQSGAILDLLASMQIDFVGRESDLLALGCADRRLGKLAAEIAPLLSDPSSTQGLEAGEVERLRALVPTLESMCARLASYNIPETLVHGDFYGGNTVVAGGHYMIFDWTDVALSHPFLDLVTGLHLDDPQLPPEAVARLKSRYLAAWAEYGAPERLEEALQLALPLSAVYQSISYRAIFAQWEEGDYSRWELRRAIPGFLRLVLSELGQR
ncbi:MAG: aminoglycoside phosphotransferase family protein [Chloroflexota bacterium]|nr:aminoglycoside phosphotransferase family protein [Chloroflexota bacterium]